MGLRLGRGMGVVGDGGKGIKDGLRRWEVLRLEFWLRFLGDLIGVLGLIGRVFKKI